MYQYIKTGNEYEKLYEALMHIGKQWLQCIIYKSIMSSQIYVREIGDFNQNFKEKEKVK